MKKPEVVRKYEETFDNKKKKKRKENEQPSHVASKYSRTNSGRLLKEVCTI